MKKKLQKFAKRTKYKFRPNKAEEQALTLEEAPLVADVPRITNETVAAHREEILKGARKYIYPLQHSKHRIILISSGLLLAGVIGFFVFSILSLYRFKSTSTFVYRITQVVPLPVARTGSTFVAYENYLFEFRHYLHYYQTQARIDFNSVEGKQQYEEARRHALQTVEDAAYIKNIAKEKKITVSSAELDARIKQLRDQNRLGESNQAFADVLKDYWGWSVNDYRRSLKNQILEQKVLAALDTDTTAKATAALAQLKAGTDFATLAKQSSEDTSTKANGGDLGLVEITNQDIAPQTMAAILALQPGQNSDLINTGSGYEIVKLIDKNGTKYHVAHITFNFKDINTYLNDLKDKKPVKQYIKV